ncbi:MAG: hypothetical protein OEU36_19400 [Gammaproteobacteria bacterium]|nr:hypothetical protein [Gammaproteobacteria bacterium]
MILISRRKILLEFIESLWPFEMRMKLSEYLTLSLRRVDLFTWTSPPVYLILDR